jgi:hypothetical protein
MKNRYYFLFFVTFPLSLFAQFFYPFDVNYNQPCAFNSAFNVSLPLNMQLFQTQNDLWDGPADSTLCITSTTVGNSCKIDLNLINIQKPLFAKINLRDQAVFLTPNIANTFHFNFQTAGGVNWKPGVDCTNEMCTGARFEIGVPDTSGNLNVDSRFYTAFADEPLNDPSNLWYGYVESCFPTEYFENQQLLEVILKIQIELVDATNPLRELRLIQLFIEPLPFNDQLIRIKTLDQGDLPHDVLLYETTEQNQGYATVAMYDPNNGFPSVNNPSYIPATITPNPTEQRTINLIIPEFNSLHFQPFTYLRGDFVSGSDSLRHIVNLVNEGSNMCLNWFDFVFDNENSYIHNGGTIELNNNFSCMQFRNGSEMRIKKGKSLHYGNNGVGMLQLCNKGTIALEENASLVVDCILNLSECDNDAPPSHIYMDLPKGANLVFTENSRLLNNFSKNQAMKLRINMLGGNIDDSGLPESDKWIIERIYPIAAPNLESNVTISPNPFTQYLNLFYLTNEEELVDITLIDLSGKIVFQQRKLFPKGVSASEFMLPLELNAGVYTFLFSNKKERIAKKIIKI